MGRIPLNRLLPDDEDGVLATALVDRTREWLGRGLTRDVIASSLRIEAFTPYGEGLKADLVGEVRVTLPFVMKVGDAELRGQSEMMTAVNEHLQRKAVRDVAIFPSVVAVVPAGTGSRGTERYLMLMQGLTGFETLARALYGGRLKAGEIGPLLRRVATVLGSIHAIGEGAVRKLAKLPRTTDPFSKRIEAKLDVVLRADPDLGHLLERPGRVQGIDCPPLSEVLGEIRSWMRERAGVARPQLAHGDPHLDNILIRRRGRGFSVRLIDPNTLIGYSDPSYDWGKLLHFAEPVGYCRTRPEACAVRFASGGRTWELLATPPEAPFEDRRAAAEATLCKLARQALRQDPERERAIAIAIASAHLGLAALYTAPHEQRERRYVLAFALRALANWSHPDAGHHR